MVNVHVGSWVLYNLTQYTGEHYIEHCQVRIAEAVCNIATHLRVLAPDAIAAGFNTSSVTTIAHADSTAKRLLLTETALP